MQERLITEDILEIFKTLELIYDYSIHKEEVRVFSKTENLEKVVDLMETCGYYKTTSFTIGTSTERTYNICSFFIPIPDFERENIWEIMWDEELREVYFNRK